jgi:soluble lytic murein transglycosylase
MSKQGGIILRRKFQFARRRVFPAVFMVALGAPPTGMMEQAQAQDSTAQPTAPEIAPAEPDAAFDPPGMPGVRMMAPIQDRVPMPEVTPPPPDAVFDAPGKPGVRMMAPIQDRVPVPVAKPAIASTIANSGEHELLQQAFAATGRNWNRARLLAAQAGNPIGKLIIEWRYVLEETSGANFETINAFLNEHPGWPRHDALMIRAEKSMPAVLDPRDVVSWYGNRSPHSGTGMIRLGEALMATGKRDEGVALIRKGWIDYKFSPFDENQIVVAHGDLIRPADQKARLDRLLAREDTVGANRQLRRVDPVTQGVANVRLKIKAGASTASVKGLLASLPESARNDPELVFEAARALRRRGDDTTAWDLMATTPSSREDLVLPERWAAERGIMARDALKAGKPDLAYQFASTPTLDADSGAAFMDGEFLAGWIALQSLHKPELAHNHFDRLAKGVTYPISVARAHYWLGRTAEAMGAPADALAEYRLAAQHSATFYGQLAVAKITSNPVLHVNAVAWEASPAERAAFEADDRVKAIRLLADFSDRGTMRLFALSIASDPPEPRRLQMLAQLMGTSGDPAMSVRVAKNASYSGLNLLSYLHPVMATPQMQMSGGAPEPALVLGLARQESEFDPTAVSGAGARGLMQLMPASAKHAASMRGMAYRQNDLTANPSYNMQLGMTTLAEYLDRWNGSYVLAIASYNAGPKNVRNWVETYGDPRDPGIDPIDWIESIPFPETRNYVQRVIENLEVYRNRLSNTDQQLGILADLYRPSGVEIATAKPVPALIPDAAAATPVFAKSFAPDQSIPR